MRPLVSLLKPICSCESFHTLLPTLNNSISGTFFNLTTFQRAVPSLSRSKNPNPTHFLLNSCSCHTDCSESNITVKNESLLVHLLILIDARFDRRGFFVDFYFLWK